MPAVNGEGRPTVATTNMQPALRGAPVARALIVAVVTAAFAVIAAAPAASAAERRASFSGRCPIDVIFPIWVDSYRARAFVPRSYGIASEAAGKTLVVVSLVKCEDTVVEGVQRSRALYSDLLFQVNPPPGSGTPLVDQFLDAYWAWVVTNERMVHRRLRRIGMFHGFDRRMWVTATRTAGGSRVVAVDGAVRWRHAPFRLHGDVVDATPAGWPQYFNYFWQDVPGGVMRAQLKKVAGSGGVGEQFRAAQFTLTTPSRSRLARLFGSQCTPTEGSRTCTVSGGGMVTALPHFDYSIEVLDR